MAKHKTFNDLRDLIAVKHLFSEPSDNESKQIPPQQEMPFPGISRHTLIEAHYSKKGRGGKIVTVLKGFDKDIDINELKKLAKFLKNKLHVGGSVKNNEIIIQGNNRTRIAEYLIELGFRVKNIGG